MITIAVLTNEKSHFDLLITKFNRLPVHFHWFETVDRFLEHKNFEAWQVVWVIGNANEWVEETLVALNEKQIRIPVICTTPFPKADERQLFWQLNVREIVPWPIHRLEMEHILDSYNKLFVVSEEQGDYAFQGSLEVLNGVDLLNTFSKANCTGALYFHWGERKGRIELQNGRIVNAVYRQMDPLTAVLIMVSWQHGFVAFKEDQFVSKRSIMLTNEQIFAECLDYQKRYRQLLAAFSQPHKPYFPHPELNYEYFGPTERKILRDMRKGKSINEIVESYEGDVNFILKKLKNWADQDIILPETRYRYVLAQIEEEENTTAVKRLMRKLFGKKETVTEPLPQENTPSREQPALEYRFTKKALLQDIKKRMEELF